MSEYLISHRSGDGQDEMSIFYVPRSEGSGLIVPERIIRAQGRVSLVGTLLKWESQIVTADQLQGETEVIEPVDTTGVIAEVKGFMETHTPDTPLEISENLPEDLQVAFESEFEEELALIKDILGLDVHDNDGGHYGLYL